MDPLSILLAIVGLSAGYGASTYVTKKKSAESENRAEKELSKAKKEADKLLDDARTEAKSLVDDARKDEQSRRNELKDLESRLVQRETALDKKL
ncbi:DUF3552 domain-containing protein, partial [Candidatus Saccharibacteria bacterium]|nr:DUF3552 domain-containing protein [Candidatus Saccharibacteria bacterium]